jgi:uncharacterized protein
MSVKRREFLTLLGAGFGTAALGLGRSLAHPFTPTSAIAQPVGAAAGSALAAASTPLGFQPIAGVIPLPSAGLTPAQQMATYASATIQDDLVLPPGYTYEVIAAWGDRLGDSRVGYNNDYLGIVPTDADTLLLGINFEYVSAVPWQQSFATVVGRPLPLAEVQQAVRDAIKAVKDDQVPGLNAFVLKDGNPVKTQVQAICREALTDQGFGILAIQRDRQNRWSRIPSKAERRITGISGLEDGRYVQVSGPGAAVFRKTSGQGYIDQLGDRIIGTMQNCAGGTTPWGTFFTAEENFQVQVPEPVYADGTAFDPIHRPFNITTEELTGLGNVFGLAGNKYGWMVEIDPANPQDFGTKHTWLGRYRHEAVGIRVEVGKPLAFYSGCDRRGGHLYKFVSRGIVQTPTDKANSRLLQEGQLYAAQFNPDGNGRWIPLAPSTPVNPQNPSDHVLDLLLLPRRPEGGVLRVTDDDLVKQYQQQFKTLADLYTGSPEEQQGAILIDAHYAANAAGATCTARPEDTEIAPDGSLYIAFTSGSPSREDGAPDMRIFKAPDGTSGYEYGWVMRLVEAANDPAALTFSWQMVATGGEPADGGQGFANPDNLAFDRHGNLWLVTDMSTDKLNGAIPPQRKQGKARLPVSQSNLRGLFGNNSLWCMPLTGPQAGTPLLFGTAPMEAEATGPCFAPDNRTLFLSIQHPGEYHGMRQNGASETRAIALLTTDGQEFNQTRTVPLGSNWPSQQPNQPPKPAIVAIRRIDGGEIAD